jgi:protease I
MASSTLAGKKVAILATDMFEEKELTEPRRALMEAGATVHVVAPHQGPIQGMNHHDPGAKVPTDRTLDDVRADEYDALVLPGGVANPDELRINDKAIRFIRAFYDQRKPIAAICHGPWTLIEADVVRGRTMTSWPSLKTDLRNAGAKWVDQQVVVDGGLVTSRKPDDIPAFNEKAIEIFAKGVPAQQASSHAAAE